MTVRMTHPNLPDQHYDAPESAVDIHRQSGWQTDDDVARAEQAAARSAAPSTAAPRAASRADTAGKE